MRALGPRASATGKREERRRPVGRRSAGEAEADYPTKRARIGTGGRAAKERGGGAPIHRFVRKYDRFPLRRSSPRGGEIPRWIYAVFLSASRTVLVLEL